MRFVIAILVLSACGQMAAVSDAGVQDAGPPPVPHCSGSNPVTWMQACAPGWALGCAYSADARIALYAGRDGGVAACTNIMVDTPALICVGGAPQPAAFEPTCPDSGGLGEWRCVPVLDGCPVP